MLRLSPPSRAREDPDWKVTAAQVESVDFDGAPALHLRTGELHSLQIATGLEGRRFNLLRVRLISAEQLSIRAGLMQAGQLGASSGDFAYVHGGATPEVIELELLDSRRLEGEPVELVLSVKGKPLDWTLLSIELLERPLEAWLPELEHPAGVTLGMQARRAFGLGSSSDVLSEFVVPEQGRLSLAFSWPHKLAPPAGTGRIQLGLRALGAEGALGFELELAPEPGWQTRELSLEALAGQRVELRLHLDVPGSAGVCALSEPIVYRANAQAPTVLLITSDTHRGDHVDGEAPSEPRLTPALDALAQRGLRFTDCYVTTNITLPSHAALFTGTHPRDTGVIDNSTTLQESAPTLAESFHEAGYLTYAIAGAWHLRPSWSGFDQGFDRMTWPPDKNSVAAQQVDTLESWLPEAEGRPLFVWLHLFDAHRPYTPPAPFDRRFYPEGRDPYSSELPEPDFPAPPGQRGLRDIEYVLAQYKGEVSYLDSQLARLFEHGRLRAATVAMTADHGESLGQHGIYWNHVGLFPEILHVPLILSWPGAAARGVSAARVRQIDIGRTLLDLAGLREAPFPGRDLLEASAAGEGQPRFGLSDEGAEASLNLGRWHLILSMRERAKESDREPRPFVLHRTELFDLEADPGCARDVSASEFERARRLRARLVEWLRARPSTSWGRGIEASDSDQAFLADLGYANGGESGTGELFPSDCDCAQCARFR